MNIDEAQGFKSEIGKQKEYNKMKKKQSRTAKEKREKKLQSLVGSPNKWKNLESYDVRTPSIYFQNREIDEKRVESIKAKLDDLTEYLQSLKNDQGATPATRNLADKNFQVRRKKDLKKYGEGNG